MYKRNKFHNKFQLSNKKKWLYMDVLDSLSLKHGIKFEMEG